MNCRWNEALLFNVLYYSHKGEELVNLSRQYCQCWHRIRHGAWNIWQNMTTAGYSIELIVCPKTEISNSVKKKACSSEQSAFDRVQKL